MNTTAATDNPKPVYPLMIWIPLAAFVLAFLGDLGSVATSDALWFQWSYRCIAVGLFFAIIAAISGIMGYLSIKVRDFWADMVATQASLIIGGVIMYAASLYLRDGPAPVKTSRLAQVITLEIVGLATMATALWLGSQIEAIRKSKEQIDTFTIQGRPA